jgi:integrase
MSTLTLSEFLDVWLESQLRRVGVDLADNTYRTRKQAIEKHIRPGLGHIRLADLSRGFIARWFEDYHKGLAFQAPKNAPGTRALQIAFETLRTALNDAVDPYGYISINPCVSPPGSKRSIKPGHVKEAKVWLSWEQTQRMLETAKQEEYPVYLYYLLLLAVTTGMRQGELFALHWEDFSLSKKTLRIHRNVTADAETGSTKLSVPKMGLQDDSSLERTIMLPAYVRGALGDWGRLSGRSSGLIFPNDAGNPIHRGNFMERWFRPLVKAAELPEGTDFHSLRHSHASLLISEGVDILTISRRLGHKKIQITLDTYGHLLPKSEDAVLMAYNSLLLTGDV